MSTDIIAQQPHTAKSTAHERPEDTFHFLRAAGLSDDDAAKYTDIIHGFAPPPPPDAVWRSR